MPKITCIIIEDEPLAAKVLSDYIAEVPFLELQKVFRDAILASEFLLHHDIDLIFLDIHLPRLKGMAFLKTLVNPPSVIVTTAYHQYAVEGFNLNVTDYLLKPIEFERFLTAVNKVNTEQKKAIGETRDFIFVNVQKRKVKILFSEILYIESQREYIKIVTNRGAFISKMSTNEIEEVLPTHQFKRIHRSFIVSIPQIDAYTAEIVEIKGNSIPIGRGYKDVIDKL
ncbi:LytR/AlgR family response regulator transcription factor [Chitinophaga arvensicola]|uniref:DNA-binding response regulator, LytR/AlgR family n=1 Tax=Chitinophaga arvensicola TaxID=29529 RepID=A0A1I0QWQ3_9BACT|nr:LytTR family DNA-binding domain-containing protein [Chitinophaga arvensicola]SEW32172.1 DNA-binding response regulator, LytR/AlgR family [Chitinophaga arvensicola]